MGARGIERTREEALEWVKRRIEELEEELAILKRIMAELEGVPRPSIDERVEDVKVGRRKVAKLYRGEKHLRLVLEGNWPLPEELTTYLEEIVSEIRDRQLASGIPPEEAIKLDIRGREIRVEGLHTTIEHLKVRAALKYIAESVYVLARKATRSDEEDEIEDEE